MHKRKDSAGDISAGSHILDAILVMALDGELNSREAEMVRSHLEACWSCRVRMERIDHAIADVVDYRDALIKPHLPLPGGPRALFHMRLRELAANLGRPSLYHRLLEKLTGMTPSAGFPGRLWAAAVSLLLVIAFLTRIGFPPPVAAGEILRRAEASQARSLRSVQDPVICRKVRVRYNGRVITRTVYHDASSNRTVEGADSSGVAASGLQSRLESARFDWNEPLSISAFISWRNSLPDETDEVTRSRNGLLTLHTMSGTGSLREIDLTMRDNDYHLIGETLRFQDSSDVEINELAFQVMAFDAVDPAIFAPSQPPSAAPSMSTVTHQSSPSIRDLADAEVEARVTLHRLHGDLGEQIDVAAGPHGKAVVVSGLVETAARKEELLRALEGIPLIETNLNTVEDAERANPNLATKDNSPVVVVELPPLLQSQLEEKFLDPNARSKFVNGALGDARGAMSTAWALRRLSERYTTDLTSKLSPSVQRALELVIRDDVASLRKQADSLNASLLPLVSGAVLPLQLPLSAPPYEMGNSADWHRSVDLVFSDAQRIHDDVAVLLAGSGNENVDTRAVIRDLQAALARVSKQMPAFNQQVAGKFLTSSDLGADLR